MSQILKIKKMKRLIIAFLLVAGSLSFANAQTKAKTVHKKATTSVAANTSATVAAPATTATKVKSKKPTDKKVVATSTTVHNKADGTPDKRFKENKAKAATAGPLKKNGTPDMRYKANKGK